MATLKNLVNETTNIKDELITCHTNLKNNLVDKGISVSSSDKLATLVDKVKNTQYIEGFDKLPDWYKQQANFSDYYFNCADFPTARRELTSSAVNNKIYVIGGYSGSSRGYVKVNECYDPNTNTWTAMKPMNSTKTYPKSCVIGNKIYVIAYNSECYDTTTDTWTSSNVPNVGLHYTTASVVDNKIYVIGGANPSGTITNSTLCYDTITNTSTYKAGMYGSRRSLTSSVVNNKIYAIGGNNGGDPMTRTECYDPTLNTWTTLSNMPTKRDFLTSSVINDKIYVFGGGSCVAVNECYDPNTDTWTAMKSMITGRSYLASSSIDGRIYIFGGITSNNIYLSKNECYIP